MMGHGKGFPQINEYTTQMHLFVHVIFNLTDYVQDSMFGRLLFAEIIL